MPEKIVVQPVDSKIINDLEGAVIKTLLYFDIFNYPLTGDEIFKFLALKSKNIGEVKDTLTQLTRRKLLFQFGNFFSVQNNQQHVERRKNGNQEAEKILPKAKQRASLIGSFPFVRSVMASGSLSKGYMDQNSDLDFFIVTAPGRLYVARMLLVLYKRLFLKNSSREFCVNYFVSCDRLEIEEKNQFTATELATVIPLYGQEFYRELISLNSWLYSFFPNYTARPSAQAKEKDGVVKKLMEGFINISFGKTLDHWCMHFTQKRWEKLYRKEYADKDFEIAFKSKKHVSKSHPRHYQKKVTTLLDEKWESYMQKYNCDVL